MSPILLFKKDIWDLIFTQIIQLRHLKLLGKMLKSHLVIVNYEKIMHPNVEHSESL